MPVSLSVDDLRDQEDVDLGVSDWTTILQGQIDTFADATHDHQWIHVDPARATDGPFGETIAHGYLLLSLIPFFVKDVLQISDQRMGMNYGLGKVRFTSPVRVGSRVRGRVTLAGGETKGDGVLYTLAVTVEIDDAARPALVADVMYMAFA